MQILSLVAAALAVVSLLGSLFFVRDRRQRLSGIFLSIGLLVLTSNALVHDPTISIALTAIATLLAVASVALSVRAFRAHTS